jgi:redox-sensing transcriptional repressor
VAVVGIGNLGRALVNSEGFSSHGFRVTALFDIDPDVVGTTVGPVTVQHVSEVPGLAESGCPRIGVVSTPAGAAQEVADALVGVGVRSLLNFAPRVLSVPADVILRYVDLSIELQVLSFYQHLRSEEPERNEVPVLRAVGLMPGPEMGV